MGLPMRESQTNTSRTSNTGAAVLLGSVLGVILGGGLVTGVCGWKLWAASQSAKVEAGTRTVPAATYTTTPQTTSPYVRSKPAVRNDSVGVPGSSQNSYGYPAGYSGNVNAAQPATAKPAPTNPYSAHNYNPGSPNAAYQATSPAAKAKPEDSSD